MKLSIEKEKREKERENFHQVRPELILFQQQTNGGEHVIARNYL